MFRGNVIIDLSGERAKVGLSTGESGPVKVIGDFSPAWRVAIQKTSGDLLTLAGDDCEGIQEDDQTLIFEELNVNLPRIEDDELQARITRAFWNFISKNLSDKGVIDASGRVAGYVIPNYSWPASVLERFRASCATERGIRLRGFPNESAALLVGLMRDGELKKITGARYSSSPITFCLIVARDDMSADVCCFTYSASNATEYRLIIRDFFHATSANVSDKLKSRKWYRAYSTLVLLESESLSDTAQESLKAMLNQNSQEIVSKKYQAADLEKLKLEGGAYIAQCCAGRGASPDQYAIGTAYNIGVLMNQNGFHSIMTESDLLKVSRYPFQVEQLYRLKGRAGNEMRINAFCGYSNAVEESAPLGHFTLSQQDIVELSTDRAATISASVRLDSPGRGEITIRLLPSNKMIGSKQFTLPGLMV